MNIHSLKLKFIIILIAILGAVMLLQTFYFVPKLENYEAKEIVETQQRMAQQLTNTFALNFQQTIAEIEAIANLPGIMSLKKEELDRILTEMNQATQFFNYYFIVDPGGTVISYPSKQNQVGATIDSSWFRDSAEKNATLFLDVHFAQSINKLVSGYVTPIHSPDGEVIALIRGVITISEDNALLEQINTIKIGENGYVYIVDSNSHLLAHPELSITPEDTKQYNYSVYGPVLKALHGESGVTEYTYNDQIWIAAYQPIPATGWALVVQQPKRDIERNIREEVSEFTRFLLFSFLLITVCLVSFFIYALSPLTRLLQSIRSQQPFKAHSFPQDEIGTLAQEFNKYSEQLEEKVIDRTEALRHINDNLNNEIAKRKSILRASPVGIGLVHNRVFSWVSEQVVQLTGYSHEELVGQSARIVYPNDEEFDKVGRSKYGQIKNNAEVGEVDTIWRRKDGTLIDVHLRSTPINPADLSEGVTFSVLDITERKKMEQDLLRAQKLESLGILAGGIAHDFNNLLQSIVGNISLAKICVNKEDKVYSKLIETEKAATRATALTLQLLTFAKGGAPIKKIKHIQDVIKNSASFSLQGSNVRCEYFFADDLWPVDVDEGQIGQVIQNIVINSDHAMPGGGVITINAGNCLVKAGDASGLDEGRYVQVSIKDNGIGIPTEHLSRIFDPYYSTKQTGSGLGLAVAYSVINNHGGQLTARSEAGKGATFTILLPASDINQQEITGNDQEEIHTGQGRILIMDDETLILDVASEMLQVLGYEVTTARDGRIALEEYKNTMVTKPYDFVILDLTVPGGMGGEETANKILELNPDAKVLVSSGYANDPIMAEYNRFGFCGVIPKPYSIESLSKVLNNLKGTPD